jgi:hypothetical protein
VNRFLLLVTSLSILVAGCSTTKLLDFTLLSNRSIHLAEGNFVVGPERVSGDDKMFVAFILPFGQIDIGEALSRAISSHPGCVALQDETIVLEQRTFFPLVCSDSRIIVEGFPVTESPAVASPEQ